jgi:putative transposase
MDEAHMVACARYVELNPVRAGLVARAEDWPWSSAAAHLAGRDDALVRTETRTGRRLARQKPGPKPGAATARYV